MVVVPRQVLKEMEISRDVDDEPTSRMCAEMVSISVAEFLLLLYSLLDAMSEC